MELPGTPFPLFADWMAEAEAREPNDPNAMALATADAEGRPSVRMVLLKGADERGFVFYTNFESRKGGELSANPHVALLFHWKSLRRQIRIEGPATPVSDKDADAYFASRSRGSQIGAWASEQSRLLDARETLEARIAAFEEEFEGRDVPRPSHWSGWRVAPERVEFWLDRESRLHERYVFERAGTEWRTHMLYP